MYPRGGKALWVLQFLQSCQYHKTFSFQDEISVWSCGYMRYGSRTASRKLKILSLNIYGVHLYQVYGRIDTVYGGIAGA